MCSRVQVGSPAPHLPPPRPAPHLPPPRPVLVLLVIEESTKSKQVNKGDRARSKFRGAGAEKRLCGVACQRRSSRHGQRRPTRDLHTQTTARGCFHYKWKQPQRPWFACGARAWACPSMDANGQDLKCQLVRERLSSEISGFISQIATRGPNATGGRDPPWRLTCGLDPPRTSHGCDI